MATLSTQSATKLGALHGAVTHVLHHDPKAGFTLFLNDARRAVLVDGVKPVTGVTLTTDPHESMHWGNSLARVADLQTWLKDATALDERHLTWKPPAWREACRFGRRVLVSIGENNARKLQNVGLTFDVETEAWRFFESFVQEPPRGYEPAGTFVEGKGGISREYLGGEAHKKKKVHAAVVRVIDEVMLVTTVNLKGDRSTERTTFATEADALTALNRFEFEWFSLGGQPHEIEYMPALKRRAERTLLEHCDEELEHQADPKRFVTELLSNAGLPVPANLPDERRVLRLAVEVSHAAHWLHVGERLEKGVIHHAVMNKPGVHVYLDRAHRAVAIVTVDERRVKTWADDKRAATDEKFDALAKKTLDRFKLA